MHMYEGSTLGQRETERGQQGQHTPVTADLCSLLENRAVSEVMKPPSVAQGRRNDEAAATRQETALGASFSSLAVTNFNFIFISLLCSVLELNQRNQGYGIRAGIQDVALSSSHIVSLSPQCYSEAAGGGELPGPGPSARLAHDGRARLCTPRLILCGCTAIMRF